MSLKFRAGLLLALGLVGLVLNQSIAQDGKDTKADPSVERMRKDLFFLASEECEGRGVGTNGLDLAAHYIAAQFKKAGLKPGGVNGTYFQPFPYAQGGQLDGESTLAFNGPDGKRIALKQGQDFQVVGTSAPARLSAPLVFVGYGVTAKGITYDDYAGVDVKGKVVVALRRLPRWNDKDKPFDGAYKMELADLNPKQYRAELHQAAGIILVNDATELPNDGLTSYKLTFGISTLSTPFVHMKRATLAEILKSGTGKTLEETEKAIDDNLKPQSADIKGWSVDLNVKIKRKEIPVKNVIGLLDGAGPLADETVVVGSHYDHVGYGEFGSLLGKAGKGKIHYGADDNASGTTSMMELSRRFAKKDREGRRLVFMAFTAEESGLIGSRHYCQVAPLYPLKNTTAMFNLDMVGRLDLPILKVEGKNVTIGDYDGSGPRSFPLADGAKVYQIVKGARVELVDGLQADVFKKLPVSAAVNRDANNQIASIIVTGERPTLLVEATNTAKEFDELVTRLNPGFDIVKKNSRGFFSSDQYSFYQQKIPVVFFWTGEHPDYHRPADVPEKINVRGMKGIADYAERVVDDLRTNPKRPEYIGGPIKIGGGPPTPGGIPSLRFQPDPFFDGTGVLVDQIIPGGPADKAGMKKGDVIIEMAGKAITTVPSYNAIRATLKADVEIAVKVIRDKKELTLKVTPVLLK